MAVRAGLRIFCRMARATVSIYRSPVMKFETVIGVFSCVFRSEACRVFLPARWLTGHELSGFSGLDSTDVDSRGLAKRRIRHGGHGTDLLCEASRSPVMVAPMCARLSMEHFLPMFLVVCAFTNGSCYRLRAT